MLSSPLARDLLNASPAAASKARSGATGQDDVRAEALVVSTVATPRPGTSGGGGPITPQRHASAPQHSTMPSAAGSPRILYYSTPKHDAWLVDPRNAFGPNYRAAQRRLRFASDS